MKQDIAITTDAVIFLKQKDTYAILLIKRGNEPYKNSWALPGGFLEENELLKTGCKRELEEETRIKVEKLTQVGVYDAINRDPRGRTLSVAFTSVITKKQLPKAADDAAEAHWIALPIKEKLAFDHEKIINNALKVLSIPL